MWRWEERVGSLQKVHDVSSDEPGDSSQLTVPSTARYLARHLTASPASLQVDHQYCWAAYIHLR